MTFGRILLLPLCTQFEKDYQELFWTELVDYLKLFTHTPSDLGLHENDVGKLFVRRSGESISLIRLYRRALVEGKLSEKETPLLFKIGSVSIHHFISDQVSDENSRHLQEMTKLDIAEKRIVLN
jgi:predicted Zn-dependent protease with MMP-like domain